MKIASRIQIIGCVLSIATLVISSASFTACSDIDDIIDEKPDEEKAYTMTIKAMKDSGEDISASPSSKALTLDGKKLNSTWDAGEVVLVYQDGSQIGELLSAASSTSSTTLSGTLDQAPDASKELKFYFHTAASPNYENQDGTLATIASTYDFCAPATVASGSYTVNSGNNTIDIPGGISFGANQQAIVKFTLLDKADATGNTKLNPSVFHMYIPYTTPNKFILSVPSSTYETNGDGVLYFAIPHIYNRKITLIASANNRTYACIKDLRINPDAQQLRAGKYYEINVKMENTEGLFTVYSDTDVHQIVTFSRGNLRAETSDLGANWTWSFASHQYDFIGNASANTMVNGDGTVSENGTVDLFGWSNGTANHYGIHNGDDAYLGNGTFVDWGQLTIGSDPAGTWRTLEIREWYKIFNTRSTIATIKGVSDARYTMATINTDGTPVTGVILIPDYYAAGTPDGVSWGVINAQDASYSTSCTVQGWLLLDSYGCIFLPSGAYRKYDNGVLVDNTLSYGGYWSATKTSGGNRAQYVYFNTVGNSAWSEDYFARGHSVRLVKNFNF